MPAETRSPIKAFTFKGNEMDMAFRAYCLDCKRFHDIRTTPGTPLIREMTSWEYKHRGHRIEFSSRNRNLRGVKESSRWLDFKENVNFQFAFQASVNMTYTSLVSLASDTLILSGAEALAVDNGATGAPLEIGVSGFIKNGSGSPSSGRSIQINAVAAIDDTPTWPDTLTGADNLKTITSSQIEGGCMYLITSLAVAITANQVNPFAPIGLTGVFGFMPRYWTIFIAQNSGIALASSGHQVTYKGVYVQG